MEGTQIQAVTQELHNLLRDRLEQRRNEKREQLRHEYEARFAKLSQKVQKLQAAKEKLFEARGAELRQQEKLFRKKYGRRLDTFDKRIQRKTKPANDAMSIHGCYIGDGTGKVWFQPQERDKILDVDKEMNRIIARIQYGESIDIKKLMSEIDSL